MKYIEYTCFILIFNGATRKFKNIFIFHFIFTLDSNTVGYEEEAYYCT